MKQVDKLALESAKRINLNGREFTKHALVSMGYESGFRKALTLVIEYLESVDSGSVDEWFIDLEEIQNLADKEVDE